MKKIFLILCLLFLPIFATATTIDGSISFDWLEKTQLERDNNIQEIKNILFNKDIVKKYKKNDFKAQFKSHLKDEHNKKHYIDVLNSNLEGKTERLAGFYKAGGRILYMYAIQYNNELNRVYYFDALGNLQYVDFRSENYPNYPYYTYQYKINGTLISSIYFISKDTQYMYKPNGEFNGIWFKGTMFDKNAKKIFTRNNY